MLGELLDILLFRAGYTAAVVSAGCTLLGVAGGIIGCFALLRRRSLMGDALAHATLPGIAGAFLLATAMGSMLPGGLSAKSLPVLLAGATISAALGVLSVHAIVRGSGGRIREDAAIGIVLSVFFGLGYVLLSIVQALPGGTQSGLKTFIFGQPAAMSVGDAMLLAVVALGAALAALLLYKELRLLCFDEGFARVQGWPTGVLDLAMMALVVIVVVVGLQAVGLVLVIALLIIPPAGARFWTDRLGTMLWISALMGGASGYLGVSLSALLPGVPAGAIVVLVAAGLFGVSAVAAPRHGVLNRWARHGALTRRIWVDHALRALFEHAESGSTLGPLVTLTREDARRALSGLGGEAAITMLHSRGFVDVQGDAVSLSSLGLAAATRAVRNHRLWERFLVLHAEMAPSHVDRSADMIEHVLDPELVRELEAALHRDDAVAAASRVPPSVHPITPDRCSIGGEQGTSA